MSNKYVKVSGIRRDNCSNYIYISQIEEGNHGLECFLMLNWSNFHPLPLIPHNKLWLGHCRKSRMIIAYLSRCMDIDLIQIFNFGWELNRQNTFQLNFFYDSLTYLKNPSNAFKMKTTHLEHTSPENNFYHIKWVLFLNTNAQSAALNST